METNKIHLTWDNVSDDCALLAKQIAEAQFEYDWIIGITTGGLIPLTLLAKRLDTKSVSTITATSYNSENVRGAVSVTVLPTITLAGTRILLVDEIADSGETLRVIKEILLQQHGVLAVRTAVLCMRTDRCTSKPDFCARTVDSWVQFPWDEQK